MFSSLFKLVSKRKKNKSVDTKGYITIGDDGLFFQQMDEAYLNSPTATMCLLKFQEFCKLENLKKEYLEIWNKINSDYVRYGYFILQITYNIDAEIDGVVYRSVKDFLAKEKDDNENISTFKNIKTGKEYPIFNPDKTVVKKQFEAVGYENFCGQIFMYNDTAMPYRITPLYSVLKWMVIEADSATYVAKASENAMFGNNIFVIKKSSSDINDLSDGAIREREIISEINEMLTDSKGVEKTAQNYLLEWSGDTEDVTKLIGKVSISNDVNVDLLNAVDSKAQSKICVAFYNFPKILMYESENLFGDSGAAINTATALWKQTCEREANKIKSIFDEMGIYILETPQTNGITDPNNIGA